MTTHRLRISISTISLFSCLVSCTSHPTVNLSTSWINTPNLSTWSIDGTRVSTIIPKEIPFAKTFACGFYCKGKCDSYLFAIFYAQQYIGIPEVVWSANRDNPVGAYATLEFTAGGDLILRDTDGTLTWSTDTAGKAVAGLNLTETGNLVLFDAKSHVVWQSFDHPTDCLLPGQILGSGKNLTATGGLFSLSMTSSGLVAFIKDDPPLIYYENTYRGAKQNEEQSYARFRNGSLDLYVSGVEPSHPDISIPITESSAQYMKLGDDGHLRVIQWGYPLLEKADVFNESLGECDYPLVCGKYGICSRGQCSCPVGADFRPTSDESVELGCSEVVPITCNASDKHSFLELNDTTYFSFLADIENTDRNSCKEACLRNCSCRAAIFDYGTKGCYLPSQIFSFKENETDGIRDNYSVTLKIQIAPVATPPEQGRTPPPSKGNASLLWPILGSVLAVSCVIVIGSIVLAKTRRRRLFEEAEEDGLDLLPDMPTRFPYEELATATNSFNNKLGEGGFGAVFEGSLSDGTRIAVKLLDGVSRVKKSFLAEVQTIGRIHHVNLVRLIGFCADKSHRLLVYEYMCNGSLERWIYHGSQEMKLDWNQRRNIVLNIARGLAYLHEECRKKILHLDIKPQNILVDEHFNVKLADFGLAKLVSRDQSRVVTTMRGTPGYLAPEWLGAVITEKVDVYSFGVVVLEILSGRKVFEESRTEEERYLLAVFKKKAEDGEMMDLVDDCYRTAEFDMARVEEMLQIAAWCVQSDHERRPSMSMVIKALEGVEDVWKDVDANFLAKNLFSEIPKSTSLLSPSVLSGPR